MKQPFTFLSRVLPLALLAGTVLTARAQTTYSQVPLTAASFTADIVANGSATAPPASSTTADVDAAGYYLISQDYYTTTTPHTSGIPNDGAIANTIVGPAALTYQLASLSANNSLRLTGTTSGTITFATPRAASEVYVLGVSGTAISGVDVTVNYADGTNTAFAGQSWPDWFTVDATRNVFGTSGRASTATPVSATTAANTAPFLTQLKLTIPTANLNKNITGITFAKTANSAGSSSGVLNIMAVSVASIPLCTTPPATTATVASTTAAGGTALTTACSGTNIYLSVSGVPTNGGYVYQWQSSTTSATTGFTNISGATSSTYVATNQTVATYYRALISCQFSTATAVPSTAVQVAQSPVTACYCTPTYSQGGSGDYIARVRLGSLDKATANNASPYYLDYTGQQTGTGSALPTPSLPRSSTQTLTLDFGPDGNQWSGAWIDFNQNGTFETSEFFAGTRATGGGTTNISLVIPATATLGTTRMRLRGGDDAALTGDKACGASNSNYGQAQDYLVSIATATATTPARGTTTFTLTPNPTPDGHLTLDVSDFREAVELTVFNALGQRVAATTVAAPALGQQQELNLNTLPAGVYVLQARTASGQLAATRFVRE